MSVFHVEKRLTFIVLSVILLTATSVLNNGTNIQRRDTTGLRYILLIVRHALQLIGTLTSTI